MERSSRERGLREAVGEGFSASNSIFREMLQHDREATALLAVLGTRLEIVEKTLVGARKLPEEVAVLRSAVTALEHWRESRDALAGELAHLKATVEMLVERPSVDPEAVKGKWTTVGLVITTLGSVGLGLINLLVK